MARLPQPGSDNGNWGNILNDYLAQSHNTDGSLKANTVGASQIQAGAVSKSDVGLSNVDNTSDVNKPVSNAQTATFYSNAAPAYAGNRSRPFDPFTNIYGSAPARAAVRRSLGFTLGSAKSSVVNLLISGDSFSSGWKANNIGGPAGDDWATVLKGLLKASGYPLTGGWVFAGNGQAPGDTRWTFAQTWNRSDTTANYAYTGSASASATFTSDDIGTVLEFAAFSTGTTLTYTVDGGSAQTWNLTTNQVNVMTITGLTSGTHTVTITRVSGTVWVCAARVRNTTGLSISNGAIFGSHTDDWLPTAKNTAGSGSSDISWLNPYKIGLTLLGGAPKLVLLALGANDAQHTGHTLANMKSNLATIVNAYQTAGSTVMQRTYIYPSTAGQAAAQTNSPIANGVSWDAFLSAMYDVSDTYDTALVDHSSVLGDSNTLEAGGLQYSDHLHLLTPGQAAIARADYHALSDI